MTSREDERPSLLVTPDMAREYTMTPGEVAAVFGVNPKTVARWALTSVLPCITTPGGHRRFRPGDVFALLDRSTNNTPGGAPPSGPDI